MSVTRKLGCQPDVLEWLGSQRGTVKFLRKERYKLEKGFVAYGKSFYKYITTFKTEAGSDMKQSDEELKKSREAAERSMQQFEDSQELLKRMKWKRVTWEDNADYTSLSRRVLDNDAMFKGVPAFSFMSIHLVRDPSTSELTELPSPLKSIEEGSLTNWVLRERDPKPVANYPVRPTGKRRSAFTVDWVSGEVHILDSASAQEILTFLNTVAPRLQALQLKMTDQQTRQTEDVEKVRIRVGAVVKFNSFDTSFWDDPKRKTDPDFVTPADMEQFLQGMLQSAYLYRWFLKGQQIRVVPPGRPYHADLQNMELQLPANFAEYNWLKAHSRFEAIEKIFESFRRFWWFWFCAALVFIGDVDVL